MSLHTLHETNIHTDWNVDMSEQKLHYLSAPSCRGSWRRVRAEGWPGWTVVSSAAISTFPPEEERHHLYHPAPVSSWVVSLLAPSVSCISFLLAGGSIPPETSVWQVTPALLQLHHQREKCLFLEFPVAEYDYTRRLTLLPAVSYISPSTLRAYWTRLLIRRSCNTVWSGVGNIACTL